MLDSIQKCKVEANRTKNVNLYFYTFTGNCRKIAEAVAKKTGVKPREIRTYNFPYLIWLILSFIPYFGVKISAEKPDDNRIILCFPKWTLNCPPVTSFLRKFAKGRKILMIICYGGFDERRYAEFYRKFAIKCGAVEADYLLVKRRKIEKEIDGVQLT